MEKQLVGIWKLRKSNYYACRNEWIKVHEVFMENSAKYLAIFQEDEPNDTFCISIKKPA